MAIEKLIVELAKGTAKQYAPFPFNTVLVYLIEEVTQQKKELSSLEKKLGQYMIAPFEIGRVYLEEAKHAPTQSGKRENLAEARKQFITATQVDLQNYPLIPIKSSFYVGVCYDLLNDGKNALRWYEKSHSMVGEAVSHYRLDKYQARELFRTGQWPSSPLAVYDVRMWTPERYRNWLSENIERSEIEKITPIADFGFFLTQLIAARKE